MFVKKLILNNFRSYAHAEVDFPPEDIYLTGNNGQGKTNVLEAIHYLTLGRSFRKAEDKDLIRDGTEEASIYLIYNDESDGKDHVLSCLIGRGYKVFSIDDRKAKTLSEMLGKLLAVHYDPSQVFFFKDEPGDRRKLLDETLSQLDGKYLYAIARYKKLLKERNVGLAQNYDVDVLNVLRDQLSNLAYRIVTERKRLVALLSKKMERIYSELFSKEKSLSLLYRTNCPLDDDQESFVQNATALFDANRSLENLRKTTLIGPHRDNLSALLDGKDVAAFGSQGENRLASLSLRLAIRELFHEKTGKEPLLLLDDVASDLDATRCQNLLQSIKGHGQAFVTGAQIREGFEDYQIYVASEGSLRRKEND